jgi:hypothetical protein
MNRSTREAGSDSAVVRAVPAGNHRPDLGADGLTLMKLAELNRASRSAFFRLLMRLRLRYTIYDGDVVVIERPQAPALVVDLSTGRIENG